MGADGLLPSLSVPIRPTKYCERAGGSQGRAPSQIRGATRNVNSGAIDSAGPMRVKIYL